MRRTRHYLVLEDRGLRHRHRWAPSCACDWAGVPRRRKDEAVKEYGHHLDQQRRRAAADTLVPQPVGQWPEGA